MASWPLDWHRRERENQVTRWFFSFLKHPMNPTGITGASTVHVQCTADSRRPTHRATSVLFSYVQQVIISFVSNVVSRSTGHRGCALAPNFEHYYCLSKSKGSPTANQEGKLAHVFFLKKKEKTLLLYWKGYITGTPACKQRQKNKGTSPITA